MHNINVLLERIRSFILATLALLLAMTPQLAHFHAFSPSQKPLHPVSSISQTNGIQFCTLACYPTLLGSRTNCNLSSRSVLHIREKCHDRLKAIVFAPSSWSVESWSTLRLIGVARRHVLVSTSHYRQHRHGNRHARCERAIALPSSHAAF